MTHEQETTLIALAARLTELDNKRAGYLPEKEARALVNANMVSARSTLILFCSTLEDTLDDTNEAPQD